MQQTLFAATQQLPLKNAQVIVQQNFLPEDEARSAYGLLRDSLQWEQPEIQVAGQRHKIPRLQAWYGDPEAVYTYSKHTFIPRQWTAELSTLRTRIEDVTGAVFNSVLANYYRSGADGMGFHADNEPELGPTPVIASLSLGAPRQFVFKAVDGEDKQRYAFELKAGDLLVMSGETQRHWRHGLPKTRRPVAGRINLTFRYVVPATGNDLDTR